MKEKLQQFITLTVNRREYEIPVGNNRGDMPQSETLAHTLRDRLHLMGLRAGGLRLLYGNHGWPCGYFLHGAYHGL